MQFLISFLNVVLPLLYFACLILYGLYFFRNEKSVSGFMSNLLRVTVGIHFIEVILRGFYFEHFPMAGVFEAATVLALSISLVYLYIEVRLKEKSTGFFILIMVFSLQLVSSAFIDYVDNIPEILNNPLFIFHTSTAIIGYTGLAISALYSLMYLLLFKQIKTSRFGILYDRLPSLAVLDEMNHKSIRVGLFFLTVAVILGFFWSKQVFGTFLNFDFKVLITLFTWLFYFGGVFSNKFLVVSGKKAAMMSLLGFFLILVSNIFMNLFMESFHKFFQ